MERKKLLRYLCDLFICLLWSDSCLMTLARSTKSYECGILQYLTVEAFFSAGCWYSSAAPPEAGVVLDVCSRKQTFTATILGEERRAVL